MISAGRHPSSLFLFFKESEIQNGHFPSRRKIGIVGRLKPSAGVAAFWTCGLVISIGAFFLVSHLTACWQLTALPGVPPAYCGATSVPVDSDAPAAPVADISTLSQAAPAIDYPQWDGASRLNIAFFGLRGGDISGEDCPACTDTIILLTIDPVTKTAGMLSLPRDLWVNIPSYGYSRINTAWTLGEAAKLPGGGPVLAMKTVSQFVGVPIQYYVQVDFDTFISFIDMLGGVEVVPEHKMKLDPIGEGTDHFVLQCCQLRHLNGKRALAYARCRDAAQGCTDGDVGRAKRQQQVILAVRDRVFNPEEFARLMLQAPTLYSMFSSGIHTNMSLQDTMKLAVLAKDIRPEDIRGGVVDDNMVAPVTVTLAGVPASVLRPIPDSIRVLRDEIFTSAGPVGPLAQGDPIALMREDQARIRIVNNTYATELDARTGNYLLAQGMQVTERGASTGAANQTVVVVYSPKIYALRYLKDLFGLGSSQIIVQLNPAESVDIEIRLGADWVDRLPPGY